MSIENTLERIATALEKIAAGTTTGIVADTAVVAAKAAAKKATDEIKEKQEEIRTDKEDTKSETTGDKKLAWGDVSKELFAVLTEVKGAKGLDKAKAISAQLAKKYSNGVPPTATNTDPAQYSNFLVDLRLAKIEALA